MLSTQKNNFYDVITDKRAIPYSNAITGTLGTDDIAVQGTGTLFKAEVQAGSWLVDLASWEVRKVKTVYSDTLLYLYEAFTANIAPGSIREFIPMNEMGDTEISVMIPSVDALGVAYGFGLIDNKVFPSGVGYVLSKSSKSDAKNVNIDPIIVDATGTLMLVSILY